MSVRRLTESDFRSSAPWAQDIVEFGYDIRPLRSRYDYEPYPKKPAYYYVTWSGIFYTVSAVGIAYLGIRFLYSKLLLNAREIAAIVAQAKQPASHNLEEINHKILSSIHRTVMDLSVNVAHLARVNQKLLELGVDAARITNIDQKLMELSAGLSQIAKIDQKFTDIDSNLSTISSVIQGPTLKESSLGQCAWAVGSKAASGTAWLVKTGSAKTWDYFKSFGK